MNHLLKKFRMEDAFLGAYEELVVKQVIPYQEKALRDEIPGAEKSHAIDNFRLAVQMRETGKCDEEFYGMVFQDSDLAKWLEAAAYSLINYPDPELEARMDALINLIGRSQHEDGYLNTYFTVKEPARRWTDLQEAHELYCAGHMIEAAVAYYEATGKDTLLRIMRRMADHIAVHFLDEGAAGYPGHPEIELALMRLYEVTGELRYRDLAAHFVNVRGVDPDYFRKEAKNRGWCVWGMGAEDLSYAQNHAPVREQKEAVGHSVRAVYLYSGMADLAVETGDETLVQACKTLWDNIVRKRMYVTGGIGSTGIGEAFTADYHLPNDTAYAETCASIGLIFFASRMLHLQKDHQYGDVMERALYNTVLAGMQLDGKRFFYVNPLEVIPGISGEVVTHRHDLPQRPPWFGCACCPPNVSRLLTSIANYAWEETADTVYAHLYVGGKLNLSDTKGVEIRAETRYPFEGTICYRIQTAEGATSPFTFAVRLPDWCKELSVQYNGAQICTKQKDTSAVAVHPDAWVKAGYLYVRKEFADGDAIAVNLDMTPYRVYSNPAVAANSGAVALMRGPLVYCVEGVDNDMDVLGLSVCADGEITVCHSKATPLTGVPVLHVPGVRAEAQTGLYLTERPKKNPVTITAIPYYAWSNRGLNEMRVWLPEREEMPSGRSVFPG